MNPSDPPEKLGQGRSGEVYLDQRADGTSLAVKVFGSESVTKLVQILLLGAPNPYLWNRNAVECALTRRRILAELVSFWFGDSLRVATGVETRWNEEHHAYELRCEFIQGRHVALRHPLNHMAAQSTSGSDPWKEVGDLTKQIMRPLQAHLIESGFDGLVWQAGKGNPVALNNFMRESPKGPGAEHPPSWVWIDLESGIPALVPLNPLSLLGFYLPRSFRHRGPLFDDVDVPKLRAYLEEQRAGLLEHLGADPLKDLFQNVDALEASQRAWKELGRLQSTIGYALSQGKITKEEADRYAKQRIRWRWWLTRRAFTSLVKKVSRKVIEWGRWLVSVDPGAVIRNVVRFLISQSYRAEIAHAYVSNRIRSWEQRKQLTSEEAGGLHQQLEKEESSAYLTDFGVHLAIKPFMKAFQWWLLPALLVLGVISEPVFAFGLLLGGAIGRTAYTFGRLLQSAFRGREKPWVALFAGVLPVIGNLAYPLQIVYSGSVDQRQVGQFIVYDIATYIGQRIPIWGGQDTLTEHVANRLAGILFFRTHRKRSKRV